MDVKKIYFDMDGVLADFDRGLIEICGIEPIDQSMKTEAQDDEMFARMREHAHYYDELEPIPGAIELFKLLHEKYGDKCEILSGIPKPRRGIVSAEEDKVNWIHRLISPEIAVNIVYREQKKDYCKGKEYILIDDLNKNISEWEALGGTGILHTSVDNTREHLHKMGII